MEIQLFNTPSENNRVGKTLHAISSAQCTVKGNISFITPTVLFAYDGIIADINYAYIPDYARYYFIRDIRGITGNRYEIMLKCDVLESFKADIKNCPAILANTENVGLNRYLPSDAYVRSVKSKTDIITFDNGLLDNGEFILITAGG